MRKKKGFVTHILHKIFTIHQVKEPTLPSSPSNLPSHSCSRTSKAFSNKQTVKQCGCTEVYRDCMQAFLPALSCPFQRGALRSSVRSFLHRMIICLEEEVLPFIPAASEHMLKECEARDLQEFIPLISQMTAKFKVGGASTRSCPTLAT